MSAYVNWWDMLTIIVIALISYQICQFKHMLQVFHIFVLFILIIFKDITLLWDHNLFSLLLLSVGIIAV